MYFMCTVALPAFSTQFMPLSHLTPNLNVTLFMSHSFECLVRARLQYSQVNFMGINT